MAVGSPWYPSEHPKSLSDRLPDRVLGSSPKDTLGFDPRPHVDPGCFLKISAGIRKPNRGLRIDKIAA